jgi:hypothetical protein
MGGLASEPIHSWSTPSLSEVAVTFEGIGVADHLHSIS